MVSIKIQLIVVFAWHFLPASAYLPGRHLVDHWNKKFFAFPFDLYPITLSRHTKPIALTTLTSLVTATQTDTTSVVCAKLINVTGPCVRRRGSWVEEPIVLTFHEELDAQMDILYSPVLGVESTLAPMVEAVDTPRENIDNHAPVDTSLLDVNEDYQRYAIPYFLFRVTRWLKAVVSHLAVATTTVYKTNTVIQPATNTIIFQETLTFTQTKTVYNTVFVQRCTPSPFPFSVCNFKRAP